MKGLALRLWPIAIIFVLAAMSFGRLLENDNILADHALSDLLLVDAKR